MNGYQWTVLFAAWLGWGFDVFDGLLFNYVAPNCVPTLLGLKIGSPEARSATFQWIGYLTAVLLVFWAVGGIVFGRVCDRIGRTRTLLLTMALYALGTAACAFAPNMAVLVICRIVAALGIGGEWAAGAAMVAEVVPEKRRVEAGALLYTSAPLGLFLAQFVDQTISGVVLKGSPETSWRAVFLCGLIPAAVALLVRMWVKEPERWKSAVDESEHPRVAELFKPEYLPLLRSGLSMAVVALLLWWTNNAFMPSVASGFATLEASRLGLDKAQTTAMVTAWRTEAATYFNLGGLIGTLLTIPIAKRFGRKPMYAVYLAFSAVAIFLTFIPEWPPETRLKLYGLVGLSVFGMFGSFTYYLPELFPTRLRATGAGFCYNAGRIVTAGMAIFVSIMASQVKAGEAGTRALTQIVQILGWSGAVAILGLLFLPMVIETKHKALAD
ncbi:MAG: MFS transporter [Armatimonadetes bacterium]|nr:MFS transporter [Armatimonadota bacterium]